MTRGGAPQGLVAGSPGSSAARPHPDLDSDFELFCETLVPALGIEP